jgi:hypothetical protein
MRGWSVFGCGVMQLGLRRDRKGGLETTRWATLCYLPLLPLSRWRVRSAGLALPQPLEDESFVFGPKDDFARQKHTFPGGTRVSARGEEDLSILARLEVERPGGKREVLVKEAAFLKFFPSPDARLLAVATGNALFGGKPTRILVLDARGNTVADVNVQE